VEIVRAWFALDPVNIAAFARDDALWEGWARDAARYPVPGSKAGSGPGGGSTPIERVRVHRVRGAARQVVSGPVV
jgi:hypothetical protein